jgi:tetratricopeptide (TPR) repeat protein
MAYKYIELGLEYSPEDIGLRFQYAQILLRLGKYQLAFDQFQKAEILGIEHVSLLTYYAEIAFHNRHFHEVKQLMTAIELPAAYPVLTTAARFWRNEVRCNSKPKYADITLPLEGLIPSYRRGFPAGYINN